MGDKAFLWKALRPSTIDGKDWITAQVRVLIDGPAGEELIVDVDAQVPYDETQTVGDLMKAFAEDALKNVMIASDRLRGATLEPWRGLQFETPES